jgi:hypothetical protein
LSWNLWRIYIMVWGQETWGSNTSLDGSCFSDSRFDQSLKSSFLKPWRVSSWVWTADILQESGFTLAPLYFICTLDVDPSVNSLDPKKFAWLIGSLDFGLSLVLEPSVGLCLIGAHVLHGMEYSTWLVSKLEHQSDIGTWWGQECTSTPEFLFGPIPCKFYLGMKVLAWCIDVDGIKIKNILKCPYPIDIKNAIMLIIYTLHLSKC